MATMMGDKAIPLYYQLATILRERILSGGLPSGSPLPGEEALGREYQVSRITIRRALSVIEAEGLIVRIRGRGTFVGDLPARVEPTRFSGAMEDLIALGVSSSVRVLGFQTVDPPDNVAEKLDLVEGEPVVRIDKARFIEGEPFSLVVNYLPQATGERLSPSDLSEKPLLVVLEEKLGIKADEAIQTIGATIAGAEDASLLDVRVGAPLLKVERTVFDIEGKPVEHVSVLYRADKYFYTVRLKRNRTEETSGWSAHGVGVNAKEKKGD